MKLFNLSLFSAASMLFSATVLVSAQTSPSLGLKLFAGVNEPDSDLGFRVVLSTLP